MPEPILTFGGRWRLSPAGRWLMAGDQPVPLGSRAFDLLLVLVEARGTLVTKDELLRRVWPDTVVEENNLQVQISALRKALGAGAPRLIATIPGRGYRFTAAVRELPDGATDGVAVAATVPAGTSGPDLPPPPPPHEGGRPTLAVLPFANMTADPEQEYFADGMTDEITSALSHARWFSVVARSSAFTYKGRAVDVRQVGRELGVGYVLEGSVRKAGGRVRIAAELCEAATGRRIWAERFDGELADIFGLQDRVTEAVAGGIEPSLRLAELERARVRPTGSLTAYDLYLRALPWRSATRERNDEGLALLRRAVALDSGFIPAKALLAGLHAIRFAQGWADEADLAEAVRSAREAIEGREADPTALAWAANALALIARDYDAGLAAAERALALAPNSAMVLLANGLIRTYVSEVEGAVPCLERALRLSPLDPALPYITGALSLACLVAGRYEEGVEWARRAVRERPAYLPGNRLLVANLARLGRRTEAAEALRALLALAPGYTVRQAAAHLPLRDAAARAAFLSGLREAGLPE